MKKLILGALAFLNATAAAPAMAITDITPPWGDAPAVANVGSYTVPTSPPAPVIVIQIIQWERMSDHACFAQQIGSAAGLSTDYTIHGTTGDDILRIRKGTSEICGKTINPLVYNGHFLDFAGGDGNDVLTTWGGDTWLWGEGGDDGLYSENPSGKEDGGPGSDAITYVGPSGSARLVGGDGNDCLSDANRTSRLFDCGAGSDLYIAGKIPVGAISCETSRPSCVRGTF